MRQNMFFGLLISLVVIFSACEKEEFHTIDNPDPKPEPEIHMVKEETGDDYVGTYKYNNKGQILEEAFNDGYKYLYSYHPDLLEIRTYDSAGALQGIATIKLNAKGLYSEQTRSGDPRKYFAEYDEQDRLIKSYSTYADGSMGNQFYYFYNAEGDLVKDSLARSDGYWRIYTYEVYPDIPNTVADKNFGKSYLGNQSKHCFKRRTLFSSVPGELHITDFVRPLQDEKGRVTERTIISTNVTQNITSTYFYKYKYY